MEISLRRFGPATLLLLAACGSGRARPSTTPDGQGKARDVPLDQLYVLEMRGVPPEDTSATFATGALRKLILRHGPPDNTVFVELTFPADAFPDTTAADSVTVTVHPRPGIYGVDVTTNLKPQKAARSGSSTRCISPRRSPESPATAATSGSSGRSPSRC